ncbi:dihydrofolate reductase family protein [Pseudokineococcus basanitobsidens]|uniref:Dihydrofolate reductase family protein n=1 Tax=Pseudokineococcus basanitobsidens TaxID=1926649 RepID=A0ABU8RFH4_9ACTN
MTSSAETTDAPLDALGGHDQSRASRRGVRGCVYIGLSVDGFIARLDGDLDWLTERGEAAGDAGFRDFVSSVDAVLMGRGTYEVIADYDSWPYLDKPVHVLSSSMKDSEDARITVHGDLDDAVAALADAGCGRVYVDGGRAVQACLAAGLVTELTLSRVPVLIGAGAPLFGPLPHDVDLVHRRTEVLGGGMVQTTYDVRTTTDG